MVSDINHDIETQSAVGGDRLIQGAVKDGNQRLDVLAFSPWPQTDAGQIPCWGSLHKPIDAKVHPQTIKSGLDFSDNARLT